MKHSPLHLLQAFLSRTGIVLGHVKVDGKLHEGTAVPDLPDILNLVGRMAAADAMRVRRAVSARTVEKGEVRVFSAERDRCDVFQAECCIATKMQHRSHVRFATGETLRSDAIRYTFCKANTPRLPVCEAALRSNFAISRRLRRQ